MADAVTKERLIEQAAGRRQPSSEGTLIEQSRAVAQVQGALVVARQHPRDEIAATDQMRSTCQNSKLAEQAFFRYSRGGSTVSGPSIHLATELARCWGNIDYGIVELRRDDVAGESEMQTFAWDLESNLRISNTFVVPHRRDKRDGAVILRDLRDIYENNANAAARRLRECILRCMPKSFVEEAKDICAATLRDGGGKPIEERRNEMLAVFHREFGVTRKQVEQKMGRSADKLTDHDLGQLRVIFQSLRRGEMAIEEEFPDDGGQQATEELKDQAGQAKSQRKASRRQPAADQPEGDPATEEKGTAELGFSEEKAKQFLAKTAYGIPSPLDDMGKKSGTTWPTWRAQIISVIRVAESPEQLNKLWTDNESRLDHDEMPAMARQAVESAVEDRRAELA